ncbi:zinc-dependent alcohol dehydrogenase [Desulfotomaculum sp. 1211_IL3151]|uniref:zinc-dependent alcohol dehydrogenase n=1 Tax=Desulfotomaculum sp. 1211_IL3151 TaxID=3084055 RepID=UPI002FDA6E2A
MRKAVIVEPYRFEIHEAPSPNLQEGFAIVQVAYCGVCGSELHVYEGKHPKVKPPANPGHEAVGTIQQIASGTNGLKVGDQVAIVPLVGCQECDYCKLGYPNLCKDRKVVGFQLPGCLADEVAIPVDNLIKLPENCELVEGALLEPMAVVVHSVGLLDRVAHRAKSVVIAGAGTIGILIGLFLKETKGLNVYFLEINPQRKKLTENLGFKVYQRIEDLPLQGERTVAFECTGNKMVLDSLVTHDPAPEVLVILGTFEKTLGLNIFEMCKRETFIIGSQMYTKQDLEKAAEIMASPLKDRFKAILVERIYSLAESKEAFDEALSSKNGTKVLIQVNL